MRSRVNSPCTDALSRLCSSALAWGLAHGRWFSMNFNISSPHGQWFFKNCSNVGPFHSVKSFRSSLLQLMTPQGHKSYHETCSSASLSMSLLSPSSPSCQEPTPAWSSPGSTASFGHPHSPVGGVPGLQVALCSPVMSHDRGLGASQQVHHRLQGNLRPGTWGTSCPSFLPDLGIWGPVSLIYSHLALPDASTQ